MVFRFVFLSLSVMALMTSFISSKCDDDPKAVGYPDPLISRNGEKVTNAEQWKTKQRAEILELFRNQMYGKAPGLIDQSEIKIAQTDKNFLGGKAIRVQMLIKLQAPNGNTRTIDVMLVLPNSATDDRKCPVFLGLNFCGNHGIHPDPGILLSTKWMPAGQKRVVDNRATDAHRGVQASRWPLEQIIDRGFGVATAYYGDLEEDHKEGWKNGVRASFPVDGKVGDQLPEHAWGAIGAWAWGLSRIMDALENIHMVDAKRVYVHGHSRLGKTALWAGACDERFAMVISNNSGEGGAALARRLQGERTADLNRRFPHWFCKNFHQYSEHEEKLPFDQHWLIACMAPRPVYIASASDDDWADPEGEFLAGVHAEPVYKLFNLKGLGTTQWPAVQTPVGNSIRYHLRQGKHDVTSYDWEQWMQAAPR